MQSDQDHHFIQCWDTYFNKIKYRLHFDLYDSELGKRNISDLKKLNSFSLLYVESSNCYIIGLKTGEILNVFKLPGYNFCELLFSGNFFLKILENEITFYCNDDAIIAFLI